MADLNKMFYSITNDWFNAIKRYPLFVLSCIVFCIYLSFNMRAGYQLQAEYVIPLASLALSWLATYVYHYFHESKSKYYYLSFGVGILLSYGLYLILKNKAINSIELDLISISVILMLHMIFSIIPFINFYNEKLFLTYNVKLLENFAESFILNLILYALLSLAFFGITTLFDIRPNYKFYEYLLIWIAFFLHSLHFISNLPTSYDEVNKIEFRSRFFKILNLYILIPVTIIYALIIYAYMVKLLIQGSNKPWITEMCGWYMAIGMITYLFSKLYTYNLTNKVVIFFIRYFPFWSLPILLIMVYSCYIRLIDNGVTTDTYYLALITVIAVISILLFILNKNIDKRFLPYLIVILSMIAILPLPINVWESTARSQKNRLERFLIEDEILKNNQLQVPINKSTKNFSNIQSALYQLSNINELSFVKQWDKQNLIQGEVTPEKFINTFKILESTNKENRNNQPNQNFESYDHLPLISVSESTLILPLLNNYNVVQDGFEGLRINDEGNVDYYQRGVKVESLIPDNFDKKKQLLLCKRSNGEEIKIYMSNISYWYLDGKLKIRDVIGIGLK